MNSWINARINKNWQHTAGLYHWTTRRNIDSIPAGQSPTAAAALINSIIIPVCVSAAALQQRATLNGNRGGQSAGIEKSAILQAKVLYKRQ